MRRCIALSLSQRPYASSYMIMDFVPKPAEEGVEAEVRYMDVPSQLLYDKIDAAISCNENASDWELHDFIVSSQGLIGSILQKGLDAKSVNVNDLGKEEFEMYSQEVMFFIERIGTHPTMVKMQANAPAPEANQARQQHPSQQEANKLLKPAPPQAS